MFDNGSKECCENYAVTELESIRRDLNMTDKEAAQIIRTVMSNQVYPRGNGKSRAPLRMIIALSKAIDALEKGE